MSGFAGIVNYSGASIDPQVLECLAEKCKRHGGDASGNFINGNLGLFHSLLASTPESKTEVQPVSVDGKTWIIGDVRIDARDQLIDHLKRCGQNATPEFPDINLVLLAWHAWGSDCVDKILGDFSFAIYDKNTKSLFCARDHFGIKPLYYCQSGKSFVFANDLIAVRTHPLVSDQLNDAAICDYFVFGYNLDENSTCFNDINRLPPGYCLTVFEDGRSTLRKYRSLNASARITYRNPDEYQEHFLEIFSASVSDRLRSNKIAFELSGGLDSTSVAAMAASLETQNKAFSGLAITTDSSGISPDDQEKKYAELLARQHALEHVTVPAGREEDFYAYCETAQPYAWPFAATTNKFAQLARGHGKVLLSGQLGDVLMQGSGNPLLDSFRDLSFPAYLMQRLRLMYQKRSLRAFGIRTLMKRNQPILELPPIPQWLKYDMLEKSGSMDRWKELFYKPERIPKGCHAERAYDELRMPFWSHLFESYYHDLMYGIDCRHPFSDIRLIEFALSLPASVKMNKRLMRESMEGLVPEQIRSRPKAIVGHDIVQSVLSKEGVLAESNPIISKSACWIDEKTYLEALEAYASGKAVNPFTILCPLSFERWKHDQQVLI